MSVSQAARELVAHRRVKPGRCQRPGCNGSWVAGRPDKKWCSKRCGMAASRARRQADELAADVRPAGPRAVAARL